MEKETGIEKREYCQNRTRRCVTPFFSDLSVWLENGKARKTLTILYVSIIFISFPGKGCP
jgi:hypothetical protein